MNRSMPGLPVHYQLLEFTETHVHWVSDAIQPSHPLSSLLFLPPIPPSIRVLSNESTLHMRWPKYWSFCFGIIPSKEIPGLISFRMDWLDLLAVQGTLWVLNVCWSNFVVLIHITGQFSWACGTSWILTLDHICCSNTFQKLKFKLDF